MTTPTDILPNYLHSIAAKYAHQETSEDIAHYQKIIVALTETGKIMKEIGAALNK